MLDGNDWWKHPKLTLVDDPNPNLRPVVLVGVTLAVSAQVPTCAIVDVNVGKGPKQ